MERTKRPRSLQEDQHLLRSHIIPKLGSKKVAYLSRRDVESFHTSLQETPYQANRALALLSKMMSLAVLQKKQLMTSAACMHRLFG